jgi:hypothetical protein
MLNIMVIGPTRPQRKKDEQGSEKNIGVMLSYTLQSWEA